MTAALVHEDNSLLSRWDRGLFRFEVALALVSGMAIFSLMILAVISVGGRNFFSSPLPGYVDMIEQLMPLIAYAGVAYCHRLGGHVRMDFMIHFLPKRAMWGVEALLTLLTMVLILALIWGSYAHFARSFDFLAPLWSRDSSLDIALPLWPMKLLIPVIFTTFLMRLALHLWVYLRAVILGCSNPVAVPMPQNVADVAAQEARQIQEPDE